MNIPSFEALLSVIESYFIGLLGDCGTKHAIVLVLEEFSEERQGDEVTAWNWVNVIALPQDGIVAELWQVR